MTDVAPRRTRLMQRAEKAAALAAAEARRRARRGGTRPPAPVDRDLPVRVVEVAVEAPDAVGLRLEHRDRSDLPAWRPGAHVDVVLPSGRVRQYSLCGDPRDRSTYRIAVRRIDDGDGGSKEMHALTPGDALVLRGPRNAFPLVRAQQYLFVAGGIGITPLAPMARAAAASGIPWRLVHTGRDLASLPLSAALLAQYPAHVRRRSDTGHGGRPSAAELLNGLTGDTAVYVCGPPPMIELLRAAVPATVAFHSERFSPPPVRAGRPFTVRVGVDGPAVEVAADRSALHAIRAAYPAVPYSCQQGFCGTCHVPLLAGGTTGDTAGPGRTALCVARAAGTEIVVDLPAAARSMQR
ncbi:PDR/VanB family oxidoreductase [Pseudonocardia sp. CA-107938]|uniref:PDR/VanB family oxidoreductase n=1 Tax=Pseudonocardia sp. CA-107938 TaxID=3240021 RepID=UPI003D8CCAC5